MQLFVLQRENKINTSETFTMPTTFLTGSGLIQIVQIKCTSAHSNISLYCGFKELFVKGLKTDKVQGIVSSIMLLVISTKGCHLHSWGEETIIH